MFPFNQSCELSFQVSNDVEENFNPTYTNTNYFQEYQRVEQNVLKSPNKRQPRIPNMVIKNNNNHNFNDNNNNKNEEVEITWNHTAKKRIIHRDVERQRRQEMSNLYSSLRSLLPVEYIKGKRSMCDHITEAAKYIKDMEKNVNELGDKRDKLKSSSGDQGGCSSSSTPRIDFNVSIHTLSNVIQIEIGVAGFGDEDVFPLSRVLRVLIEEEGLNVVNCVSSKFSQRWMYIIHCEVNDLTSMDLQQLQQRLTSEISSI